MKLNLGMMVDGNARSTFVNVLKELNISPEELSERKEEAITLYKEALPEMYVRNARWLVQLGKELHSRTTGSEYVIYIYNMTNRSRNHFKGIEHAILEVSNELIETLGEFGDVCVVGHESEKRRWLRTFPKYKEITGTTKDNRTVLLMGYQGETGEDPSAKYIRPLDIFIRSTQMRTSGMYMPCMDNAHFAVLNHIPCKYPPAELIEKLIEIKKKDEEHDELNVYSNSIYDIWSKHEDKPLSLFLTTNALPPEEHFFKRGIKK